MIRLLMRLKEARNRVTVVASPERTESLLASGWNAEARRTPTSRARSSVSPHRLGHDQIRTDERNDPGAYTSPWTTTLNLVREDGTELFEYVCQEGNYADNLMVTIGKINGLSCRS